MLIWLQFGHFQFFILHSQFNPPLFGKRLKLSVNRINQFGRCSADGIQRSVEFFEVTVFGPVGNITKTIGTGFNAEVLGNCKRT
jgi:hypothetical protein